MPSAKVTNYLHLHFIVFVWGFTAILGELISIAAIPLVWYRMVLATVCVWGYLKIRKIPLHVNRQLFGVLALSGVIIALHWIAFFAAIKAANVSIALATLSTGAFFTAILEPIFYKRKLILYELVFGVLVVIGLYVIFEASSEYSTGIVYGLIAAFLSAVFSLINGKIAKKRSSIVISFYELASGAGFVTLYLVAYTFFGETASGFTRTFFELTLMDWGYLLVLAIICTAYAFIGSVHVMRYLSPYTVMLTTNLEPVYGIVLAYLIFGETEKMNTGFYYGAVLILGTVLLNGIFKNAKKIKRPSTS